MRGLRWCLAAATFLAGDIGKAQGIDPLAWRADSSSPTSFTQVVRKHRERLEVHDFAPVLESLLLDLEGSPLWSHSDPVYQRLHRSLAEVVRRFASFERQLEATEDVGAAVDGFLATTPTGLFQEVDQGWFAAGDRVTFEEIEALPAAQADDFLHRRQTIELLLNAFRRPARSRALHAIRLAAERWEVYLDLGRSQYPWETWLNEHPPLRVRSNIQHPPSRQWIVAHPELGVVIPTHGRWLSEATADEGLLVQLLGHVWYRWTDRSMPSRGLRWWGVSTAGTLQTESGPGFGLMALYGPTVTVGAVWADGGRPGQWIESPPRLVFGIDLYRFAERVTPSAIPKLKQRERVVSALDRLTTR